LLKYSKNEFLNVAIIVVVFWLAVDMIHGENINTNMRIFKVLEKAKTVPLLDYAYNCTV